MPDIIREQAGDALSRAGLRLTEAEDGVRYAVAGLNRSIDAAHAAGIGPRYARAMVNTGGHLGTLGRAYLSREIRSWDDIYENGPRPVSQNGRELLDLHVRPRPQVPAFSPGWAGSVPGALARAGQELVRAETGYETAYARFSDASDFAQHARVPAGQAASLVTALSGSLGDISSGLVAAEVDDWDASITLDLASALADGTESPGFWAAAADARAEKGAGRYDAAAASWALARDQLPSGHLMRDGLDGLISALRTASGTGQHVTRHGYIVHHSTEPPSPWSIGQLVEAVRNHAAGLSGDKQALRKVLDGWTDGAIAAAFDAARDPGEAVARACLFATFERSEQLRTAWLQDVSYAQPPAPPPAAGPDVKPAMTQDDRDAVGAQIHPLRAGSAEYRRDYNNGWRAAQHGAEDAAERADRRSVSHAWHDGYEDYAVGNPKWTKRDERLAGDHEPEPADPPEAPSDAAAPGRDRLIEEAAGLFPEYSHLDRQQDAIDAEAQANWDGYAYPPYEGPGYTEPPVNWEGWHSDHSEFERDHYWDNPGSHHAGLAAAGLEGLEDPPEARTEDSSPSTGLAPGPRQTQQSETTARHAQGTANSWENGPDTAQGAGGPAVHPSLDFPNPMPPGIGARRSAPLKAVAQSSLPPTRRAL